jgi:hypothetical protein
MIWLDPTAWFWIPTLVAMVVMVGVLAARSREEVVAVGILSLACLAVSFAGTAFWGWLLRDGLGPDAIESRGVLAVWRFLTAGTGLAFLIQFLVGLIVVWMCRRRMSSLPVTAS